MKVLMISILTYMVGCSVTHEQWNSGEERCKNNKGVDHVYTGGRIVCTNGAAFRE